MRVTFERGEEDLYDMVRLKAWAYSCETSKTLLLELFLFRLRELPATYLRHTDLRSRI